MPDTSHVNPPPPVGTQILAESAVTKGMTQLAVSVLNDNTVPLFGIVRSTVDEVALIARKEWHAAEPGNEQWHYGVTLYRVIGGASMGRVVETATTGARGTDSLQTVDAATTLGLKAAGVEFVMHYLGTVTSPIVDTILDAGLAFMPVTRADRFDGPAAVAELAALGLPSGCTVWLDIEAVGSIDPTSLKQQINSWALAIIAAGFEAGLYAGAGCLLTSVELYQLKVTRYWKSQSKVIDRNGQPAEPGCGWCMIQLFPSITWASVLVDVDAIQQDYRNRLPTWVRKAQDAGEG